MHTWMWSTDVRTVSAACVLHPGCSPHPSMWFGCSTAVLHSPPRWPLLRLAPLRRARLQSAAPCGRPCGIAGLLHCISIAGGCALYIIITTSSPATGQPLCASHPGVRGGIAQVLPPCDVWRPLRQLIPAAAEAAVAVGGASAVSCTHRDPPPTLQPDVHGACSSCSLRSSSRSQRGTGRCRPHPCGRAPAPPRCRWPTPLPSSSAPSPPPPRTGRPCCPPPPA